jgi:hypothetical protein
LLSCLHVCNERSAEIRMPRLIVYENMRLVVRLLKTSARKSFRCFRYRAAYDMDSCDGSIPYRDVRFRWSMRLGMQVSSFNLLATLVKRKSKMDENVSRKESMKVRRGGDQQPSSVCTCLPPSSPMRLCHFWLQLILIISTVMCPVAPFKSVLCFNTDSSLGCR